MSEQKQGMTVSEMIEYLQKAVADGYGESIVCLPGDLDEESGLVDCIPVVSIEAVKDTAGITIIVLDCEVPMDFEVSEGMFEN